MTLYEYLKMYKSDELTVFDKDYDMETYFYTEPPEDDWDKAMRELSKLLEVVEISDSGVTVNLADRVEKNLDKLSDLFYECDIDEIMSGMDLILAGNVSERWLKDFVNALK